VPGTTSPRSILFPASSLFLSFFFAPTFALPWLSFLPSQVMILNFDDDFDDDDCL